MDIRYRKFLVDVTPPVVNGITNGGTSGKVSITFNEGIATLNGNAFLSGSQISATGSYTLIVTDEAGNKTQYFFEIIIYGDVNGDGNIDVADLTVLKKHLLKIMTLSGPYKKAADIFLNGELTISDLIAVKKHILGITLLSN